MNFLISNDINKGAPTLQQNLDPANFRDLVDNDSTTVNDLEVEDFGDSIVDTSSEESTPDETARQVKYS
jgi:hypothetical protein